VELFAAAAVATESADAVVALESLGAVAVAGPVAVAAEFALAQPGAAVAAAWLDSVAALPRAPSHRDRPQVADSPPCLPDGHD
jgi:hypothetical protein